MHEVPEVENVYVIGGSNPQGTLEPRRATVVADLIHKSKRDRTQAEIEVLLLAEAGRRSPICAPISSTTAASASWRSA